MSGRISNADVIRAQEAQVETLLGMNRELILTVQGLLSAFSDWMNRPQKSASETVELTRSATGNHATGIKITAVSQNGETLEETELRATQAFERRAARYPTPSGTAHAAELGPDDLEQRLKDTLALGNLHAVPEEEK